MTPEDAKEPASFSRMARRAAALCLPPLVAQPLRRMRDRLWPRPAPPRPDPTEYSTADAPLEVPSQVECYLHCRDAYLRPTDSVLDVGLGLGYGLQIMAAKAGELAGVEVDDRSVERALRIFQGHPRVRRILRYDGKSLPFAGRSFDVVTCVDVIEHVEDYRGLLREFARVARRAVFISTPNPRPENTLPEGRPKNYWHRREWTKAEFDEILDGLGFEREWNFLDGPERGPFTWTRALTEGTRALVPVLLVSRGGAAAASAPPPQAPPQGGSGG